MIVGLDKFSLVKLCGIALAVGGAVMADAWDTSSSDNDDDEKDVVLGSIIVSIQVTGMALLMVFVKPMLAKYPSSAVTLTYYGIGTVLTMVMTAIWAFQFEAEDFYFSGKTMPWVALAYAAVFATAYTYNALSWAGQRLSPGALTVFSTFQPVGTIFLSFIIIGDVVTLSEGLGTVLVIAGLVVTVYGVQQTGEVEEIDDKSSEEADDFKEVFTPVSTLYSKLRGDDSEVEDGSKSR